MEMEILSRQNHCAHHKKSETNDIVDVSSIYFEKYQLPVLQFMYHCAITHIFSYVAIFFMFQSHVQNSILANADPKIRSNLNSLVDENKFTGFILIFAVMYKEYVDNSFARAKWGEER